MKRSISSRRAEATSRIRIATRSGLPVPNNDLGGRRGLQLFSRAEKAPQVPPSGARRAFPFVEQVFADGGYAGRLVGWAQDKAHVALEIVRRPRGAKGFVAIRRRWVVERTFAWIMKCRRLVRDYEQINRVAEALITVAAVATLVRRR